MIHFAHLRTPNPGVRDVLRHKLLAHLQGCRFGHMTIMTSKLLRPTSQNEPVCKPICSHPQKKATHTHTNTNISRAGLNGLITSIEIVSAMNINNCYVIAMTLTTAKMFPIENQ